MRSESLNRIAFINFFLLILLLSTLLIIMIWFCFQCDSKGFFLHTKSNLKSLEFNLTIILCKWNALASIWIFVQLIWAAASTNLIYQSTFNFLMWFFLSIVCLIECEIQWRTFNSGDLNWDYRTDYCRCCCWFCCSFCLFFLLLPATSLRKNKQIASAI